MDVEKHVTRSSWVCRFQWGNQRQVLNKIHVLSLWNYNFFIKITFTDDIVEFQFTFKFQNKHLIETPFGSNKVLFSSTHFGNGIDPNIPATSHVAHPRTGMKNECVAPYSAIFPPASISQHASRVQLCIFCFQSTPFCGQHKSTINAQ